MIHKIFLMILASLTALPVYGSEKDCSALIKPNSAIFGDFSPQEAWNQTGLDPENISITVENYPTGLDFDGQFEVKLKYRGRIIGSLDLYQLPGQNGTWGTYSELRRAKGKGIGALMYLIGAEILFRLYPKAETLASWDGSVHANWMWDKLVRNGHAISTPQDDGGRLYYELKRHHIGEKLKSYIDTMNGSGIPRRIQK